jgi:predicted DNA-binding protein with PD1-like motif
MGGLSLQIGRVGRIMVVRVPEGADLYDAITKSAAEKGVGSGFFSVIGSLSDVRMGYYKDGEYQYRRMDGPVEIVSCTGDIALTEEDQVIIHAHIVVSDEKFMAFGGHLAQGSHVGATAELVIIEGSDMDLRRVFDERTKLKLLKLG